MAVTKVEVAVGTIDGANLTFFTTTSYVSSTVRAILNGQVLPPDCVSEIDAATGEVLMDVGAVPRVGDVLMLLWVDAASITEELSGFIKELFGKIEPELTLEASLTAETSLYGAVDEEVISGGLDLEVGLSASLVEETSIRGMLKGCDL